MNIVKNVNKVSLFLLGLVVAFGVSSCDSCDKKDAKTPKFKLTYDKVVGAPNDVISLGVTSEIEDPINTSDVIIRVANGKFTFGTPTAVELNGKKLSEVLAGVTELKKADGEKTFSIIGLATTSDVKTIKLVTVKDGKDTDVATAVQK